MNERPHISGRQPLTPAEILELDQALVGVFQTIRAFRCDHPVAKHIKYPPVPSILSESLVVAAAETLFGRGWVGEYGGRLADVIIRDVHMNTTNTVEVKATGEHAFQELKCKDLIADWLVWVRFGRRYVVGKGPVEISLLRTPSAHIASPRRLDIRRFEAIPGVTENQKLFRFESLQELLGLGR